MRKRTNLAPAGLIVLAVLLRLATEAPPAPTLPEPVEPEVQAEALPEEPTVTPTRTPDLQIPAVPETEEPPRLITLGLTDDMADSAADAVEIRNQTGYTVSLQELAKTTLTYDADADGPTVLLIHTHTTEAYTPEPGWEYDAYDTMRTMNSRYNMVRIGDEVERVLTAAGIWVVHDEQINDYPSYNGSYGASLARIEMWTERYPSIQVVLDLHRDAAEDTQGRYVTTACTLDGEDAAQLMLVCGTDYGGLTHPDWRGNLAFAVQLQLALEQRHPGLCRPLDLRCERFNQHAAPMSLLVEVGSVGDTMARALPSAQALGSAVADLLSGCP